MANPTQTELDAIEAERSRFFTRDWFAQLLSGQKPVGDTFWLGNFGVALVLVPLAMAVTLALSIAAPGLLQKGLIAMSVAGGIYEVAVFRALWISLRRAAFQPRGWGIAGLILTAFNALAAFMSFIIFGLGA